ncbi:uncharacterized protein LOC108917609 [Anoplophora glabripennis]|uniref:uncharacterized protein LOC108917609 n=1 Tax=Anoplophora glabripennis TaxID=217634 RepID=UPI00087409C8|nr:uncharacterized protein LOC108917609 [Anoplophora glabripennis]XP_018579817.1 uncharacterized protein LOC108917609 [Anoplophora glabripennis]
MKCFVLISIFALSVAENANETILKRPSLNHKIPRLNSLDQLILDPYENRVGEITAVINDYADDVFEKVQKLIIRTGLDPVEIPDQLLKLFPTGTINLTRGWLEDTSTITRYNDVVVTYRSSMKKVTFTIPIKFDTLMFIYKYYTKVLLLNAEGDVQGKMANVRANISLSFDFETYVASLDTFDITDTGRVSLTFSGNGLIDWITSSMTSVVSIFMHPIIIRIIQSMVKGGLDKTVEVINETIKDVLHT